MNPAAFFETLSLFDNCILFQKTGIIIYFFELILKDMKFRHMERVILSVEETEHKLNRKWTHFDNPLIDAEREKDDNFKYFYTE